MFLYIIYILYIWWISLCHFKGIYSLTLCAHYCSLMWLLHKCFVFTWNWSFWRGTMLCKPNLTGEQNGIYCRKFIVVAPLLLGEICFINFGGKWDRSPWPCSSWRSISFCRYTMKFPVISRPSCPKLILINSEMGWFWNILEIWRKIVMTKWRCRIWIRE